MQSETARHVVAGTCSGVASVLVCHPLDTVRTRLQAAAAGEYRGAVDCARRTVAREGASALYKGLLWPVLAQGAYKAVMFGVYGFARNFFAAQRPGEDIRLYELLACGGLAGGANAFFLTPVELIRNRQQVSRTAVSVADIVRAARAEAGGSAFGLWRGLAVTLCRDVPGVGAYYVAFEVAKRSKPRLCGSSAPLSGVELAAAGACGGVAFWTVALPFDHIKSRLQVSSDASATMLSMLKSIFDRGGFRLLYVGFGSAILRGIPGAAIVFSVYGTVLSHLEAESEKPRAF
ncbi:mitochondrial carrier domain-containing protein [Pelagophyceae sp. CCMP2097]|nr:mitochondrial carrier domain-containing protein [Pelagophyceae sp. CCMP2097]